MYIIHVHVHNINALLPNFYMFLGIAVYSYNELMKATDQKSSVMLLGCGGFGKVFLGKLRHTMMAIKFFEVVSCYTCSYLYRYQFLL